MAIDWTAPGGLFSTFGDSAITSAPAAAGGLSSLFGGVSSLFSAGVPGVGWLSLASPIISGLFQGSTSISSAGSTSQSGLDTSGTVIGKGNATGGNLSVSGGLNVPWWVWIGGAVAVILVIKKRAE